MVQQNIGQLTGLYVLVEGKFSVQFADEKFIGTAFRALDLSQIQIWDEGWFDRFRSEKTSQNTEDPKNYDSLIKVVGYIGFRGNLKGLG